MSSKNAHIIRKQVFELVLPTGTDAFVLQQELGNMARQKLAPRLAELFDRFAGPDELIRIDRLEIDIGYVPLEHSGDSIVEAIVRSVEEQLLSRITYGNERVSRIPVRVSLFGQWLFFLENGCLPWQSQASGEKELHLASLEQLATHTEAVSRLRDLIRHRPVALDRLILQHPASFLVQLLAALTARSQKKVPAIYTEMQELLKAAEILEADPFSERWLRNHFWGWLIRKALQEPTQVREPSVWIMLFLEDEFFKRQYHAGSAGQEQLAEKCMTVIHSGSPPFPITGKWIETYIREKIKHSPRAEAKDAGKKDPLPEKEQIGDKMPGDEKYDDSSMTGEHNQTDKQNNSGDDVPGGVKQNDGSAERSGEITRDKTEEQPGQEKKSNVDKSIIPTESIKTKAHGNEYPEGSFWYVRNAGMILLHPFLGNFFKACELLENNDFIHEEARHKAVHLLQYLATGLTGLPEYELVLPKFLCGMPLDITLERNINLTDTEMSEGEQLLQAAIDHWGKLGQSSPDALRQGFLQRDGKLEKRQQGWYLTVEQQGVDILLDYLPWNLRMIKLSWMTDLLRVEWG